MGETTRPPGRPEEEPDTRRGAASPLDEFGPGHPQWCPNAPDDDEGHCHHWWDCEPCCRCGDDTPDPSCDCPRCTYVRQAEQGYPNGELREEPDLEAPWPSGMCGTKRVCDRCPSHMLCTLKARAELDRIKAVEQASPLAGGDL